MKQSKFMLSAVALGVLSIASASAATKSYLGDDYSNNTIQANSASFSAASPAQLVGLQSENDLRVLREYGDATRYSQYYKGVRVDGDTVIIHRNGDGSFKRASGFAVSDIAMDVPSVIPSISAKTAMVTAMESQGVMSHSFVRKPGLESNIRNQKSELVIYMGQDGTATLAHRIEFFAETPKGPTRPLIYIDAQNGEILSSMENLQTATITGPGGNQKTGLYNYGTQFPAYNVSTCGSLSNANVRTLNMNHKSTGGTLVTFSGCSYDPADVNGAFGVENDAQAFGNAIFGLYQDIDGTSPLTFQMEMRVHYNTNYENAFWDGTGMSFGDGATTFYPLVSLDVSAHEVSHGVTSQNSNLTYSGQSGGLNEAFSDMAGEAAEYFQNGSNDWLVGEQIFKGTGALRYMNNPTQDGRSIDHASNFTSTMDVHLSSGVYNKAYYLLGTTAGWTTRKAFQVYLKANKTYWSANDTWNQSGNGVLAAACDFGFNVADVQATLVAVGITSTAPSGCGGTTPPPPPPPTGGNVLTNGVAVTGLAAATGADLNYTMVVPAGATDLSFNLSGGTGDADMYVKFGSAPTTSSYDCRPYVSGNTESCPITTAQAGTYYVMVHGYAAFSGVNLVGAYTDGGTPPPPPPTGGTYTNSTNVSINDRKTSTSSIAVDRTGDSGTVSVSIDIIHTYVGDLKITLVAPSGASIVLRNRTGGSANDIHDTYSVNASGTASNGTWKLKVYDAARGDVGYIDSWSITF